MKINSLLLVALTCIIFSAVSTSSCSSRRQNVSYEAQAHKLRKGMRTDEVLVIMGKPTFSRAIKEIGELSGLNGQSLSFGNVEVMIFDDEVWSVSYTKSDGNYHENIEVVKWDYRAFSRAFSRFNTWRK